MEATANLIFMQMAEQLNNIRPNNILERSELAYKIVKEAVTQLNTFVEQYKFEDQEEEINYFKNIKPKFLLEQIFYAELFYLESLKPSKDKESIEQYFNGELRHNDHYFERNRTFYNYFRSGQKHRDQLFFISETESAIFAAGSIIENDSYRSEGYSFILARLQALELINKYIRNEINILNNQTMLNKEAGPLTWTGSKASLIELLYSLDAAGVFNHGKADLNTIVNVFQDILQINLGNYYSVIQQNIRIRKKNRTAFLDNLITYVERRMDETDENPRFK